MNQSAQWREKVQEMLKVCQDEIVKTTEIGKKMLNASKANSELHDTYEKLGEFLVTSIRNNDHQWDHPQVKRLMKKIEECEDNLENIENAVNKIRFADKKNRD